MDTISTVILALLTVASPLAISRAKNESWTKTTKVAVPILVSAALAIAYLYQTGSITQGGDVITTILIVYGAQQLAYMTIMRWWATILEQKGFPTRPAALPAEGKWDLWLGSGGGRNPLPVRKLNADPIVADTFEEAVEKFKVGGYPESAGIIRYVGGFYGYEGRSIWSDEASAYRSVD